MKKLMGIIVVLIAFVASPAVQAANWITILSCDNEAAIVQVNSDERRNYQVVVKDSNIIVYFNGTGAFRNAGNNFGNGREFLVGGYTQNGIFSASDFHGGEGNYNYGDSFRVDRIQSGLKLTLQHIQNWSRCDGDVSPSTGMCSGEVHSGTNVYKYADWYFQKCQ